MCDKIIENKIKVAESLMIYKNLQNMINLMFCAKKNSKVETKNYDDSPWIEYNMLNFDIEELPYYIRQREKCLADSNTYLENKLKAINCKEVCQSGLEYFDMDMGSMEKAIKIENEVFNIFFNNEDNKAAKIRLNKYLFIYNGFRTQTAKNDYLTLKDNGKVEHLDLLKLVPNHKFDFKNMKMSVSTHLGLNVDSSPMDSSYYKNAQIQGIMMMVIYLGFLLGNW
jgi:hypothetical protein